MNPLIASPTALPSSHDPAVRAAMLALAEQLLAGRATHRDTLAQKGEPTSLAVEASVRLASALVDQWRWATDLAGGALPDCADDGWWGAWPHELATDTANAADRARQRASGGEANDIELADRLEVLAWYQHRDASRLARIVNMVDLDRSYAARRAALSVTARPLAREAA